MRWRGDLVALLALALGARALVAARTCVPGRDGATYLWMAERIAAGDLGAAFDTVFHPLYPLLVGGLLAAVPGLDTMVAGQMVASGCAALAVVPLWALTAHRFGRVAGLACGLCYALGLWASRYPAECLSEGTFYLAVATWAFALLGARIRPNAAGLAVAIAFATRPEGLVLLLAGAVFLVRGRVPGAVRFVVLGAGGVALLPLAYAYHGHGLSLTPKVAFNLEVGIGAADAPITYYVRHLVGALGVGFEAIGYLVLPLAVAGGVRAWRVREGRWVVAMLVLPLAAQLIVIPLLRTYLRFLSGFGVLVLPLAGAALAANHHFVRRWRWILLTAALTPDVVRLPFARGGDRRVERELGEHLRPQLGSDRFIATEMPRLEFFAGQRPGPPRPIAPAEVLARCRDARTRFAVVVAARTEVSERDLEALGFSPLSLPSRLSTLARERGLLVYHRP